MFLNSTTLRSGPTFALIGPAVALNVVSNTGILLNFSVIFVTLRSRSLRGKANFLLALISFYEIVHQLGHLLLLVVTGSGINFIDLLTAMRFLLPSIIGMNAALVTITLAAADRLFAILASKMHERINKPIYVLFCIIISAAYGAYCANGFYSFAQENAKLQIIGSISDIMMAPFVQDWFKMTILLNLLAIGCYLIIWIAVKKQKGVTANTNSRLLKSLLLILLFNIGGYLINISLLQIIFRVFCTGCIETLFGWQLTFVNQILMNIAVAANAPILYLTSTEYRKAYRQNVMVFKTEIKKSNATNQNMPQNNNNNANIQRNNWTTTVE